MRLSKDIQCEFFASIISGPGELYGKTTRVNRRPAESSRIIPPSSVNYSKPYLDSYGGDASKKQASKKLLNGR